MVSVRWPEIFQGLDLIDAGLPLQFSHFRLRLPQPVRHTHLAIHRRSGAEMLPSLIAPIRAVVELAEAEVAVGDQGAHATRLSEGQRFAIVTFTACGVEPVGMSCDVAQQVQRMGRAPRLTRTSFDCTVAEALRLTDLAEEQTGATKAVVAPTAIVDTPTRPVPLEELLAFPEPAQRLARLA